MLTRSPRSIPPLSGLDEPEAARRLREQGANEIYSPRARGHADLVVGALREPMFLLILAAAGIYLVVGDLGEGLFLAVGAMVTIGLVVVQEARSERALARLQDLAKPTARLIRGGLEVRRPAREIVVGDVLLVGEGERVAADAVLIAGGVLTVDESALTGESVAVEKQPISVPPEGDPTALSNDKDSGALLLAGTLVTGGQGVAQVLQTGSRTSFGRIGVHLAALHDELTPLQRTAARLVGWLGAGAVAFCGLVVVAYGVLRSDWIGGILAGITVGIAVIPEEFPMVLAVFLALGAWRLASRKVLVRRAAVIEALGAATVLCVDKTGTLTQNRMEVRRVWQAELTRLLRTTATARKARGRCLGSLPKPHQPPPPTRLIAQFMRILNHRTVRPFAVGPFLPPGSPSCRCGPLTAACVLQRRGLQKPSSTFAVCHRTQSETFTVPCTPSLPEACGFSPSLRRRRQRRRSPLRT